MCGCAPECACQCHKTSASQAESFQRLAIHEVAAAIAAVDDEIRNLTVHKYALLGRYNALSPVGQLPREILCMIFRDFSLGHEDRPGAWLQIMHVNRHWRAVASEYTALWTQLSLNQNPALVSRIIALSRDQPLSVNFDAEVPLGVKTLLLDPSTGSVLQTLGQRIQNLHFQSSDLTFVSQFESVATNLKGVTCRLQDPALPPPLSWEPGDPQPDIPSWFIDGSLRSLSSLGIWHFGIDWISFGHTELTTLTLTEVSSSSQPWSVFLERLGALVHLQHLTLENALWSLTHDDRGPTSILSPKLVSLVLAEDSRDLSRFLQVVQVPTTASIHVSATDDFDNSDLSDQLIADLRNHFLREKSPSVHLDVYQDEDITRVRFIGSPRHALWASIGMVKNLTAGGVMSLFSSCNWLSRVECLSLGNWDAMEGWTNAIDSLPQLRTLCTTGSCAVYIIGALADAMQRARGSMPLPRLRVLTLVELSSKGDDGNKDSDQKGTSGEKSVYRQLLTVLNQRSAGGSHLLELRFLCCTGLTPGILARFKAVATNVVVVEEPAYG